MWFAACVCDIYAYEQDISTCDFRIHYFYKSSPKRLTWLIFVQGTQTDSRRIYAFFCLLLSLGSMIFLYTYILKVFHVKVHHLPLSRLCKSITVLQTVLTVFTFESVQSLKLVCYLSVFFL